MSGVELDAVCARMGIVVGRAGRRRWQRLGLFPLPVRDADRAEPGAAYHRRAPLLAAFVHRALGPDPGGASPRAVRGAHEALRLLRLRAGSLNGSSAGEDRFYALLGELQRPRADTRAGGREPASDAGVRRSPSPPAAPLQPRWTTVRGAMTAAELEAACRTRGVLLDRARRTYWQSARAFPQPERRRLRPPEGRGGARGYYHAGAISLAVVIDYAVRADHPAKARPWRWTVADVAHVLSAWRAEAPDEDGLYRRVDELLPLVREGRPLPDIAPRHRDILPDDQARVGDVERREAIETAGRVAAALVDAWVAAHPDEPTPDRLVVWFRMEGAGPGTWRIADAGARPTSHERRRRALRARARTAGAPAAGNASS
jgi:hypothetical protein